MKKYRNVSIAISRNLFWIGAGFHPIIIISVTLPLSLRTIPKRLLYKKWHFSYDFDSFLFFPYYELSKYN